ncbi:hypothetical protein H8356DRAFT_1321213 [Neocallimastix lanati (nom. inval.)]|nr:hypothetical protein H8356DRAFT_1321213 [Neocallimastix sp. JGI-2020a]
MVKFSKLKKPLFLTSICVYQTDPKQNNLKYDFYNIQVKYNRMVIPSVKWVHSKSYCIINVSLNLT